eukprot:TRINITY_DN5790_c0_g1_i4.p1 TRINITY_DN5790_c0_g1~~TRINITY_DN5790_c0_g1_i4.p1  ORF type:complete len:105 (-),score=13.14 TRINITY_DN5790_c0_g1_i4:39-353(-)
MIAKPQRRDVEPANSASIGLVPGLGLSYERKRQLELINRTASLTERRSQEPDRQRAVGTPMREQNRQSLMAQKNDYLNIRKKYGLHSGAYNIISNIPTNNSTLF